MPFKTVEVPEVGPVRMYKRRGAKNIRLSITSNGAVRVTLPPWVPYKMGVDFVVAKQAWISSRKPETRSLFHSGQIGKAHRLQFITKPDLQAVRTRIVGQEVNVYIPEGESHESIAAQAAAAKAAVRALKLESERLLPMRLETLAKANDFTYRSVTIKQLKGRWGSCNQQKDIVLNCFLMQLPWELIDYVLLHELTHTRIMAHGPAFWTAMQEYVPELPRIRKLIRSHQPILETV